ncbi:MAG: 3-deoxy-7-phosphoheptulonate synthase [Limnochordia bacterium]
MIENGQFTVIAGPCAVETYETTLACARSVLNAGAALFRAGAYKPRTNPKSFQGLGDKGLEILEAVRRETGIRIVTEVMEPGLVEKVAACADVLQIGTRNMSNFPLLKEVGKARRPVILKRGMAATLDELLHAAEYILQEGNEHVILCERGIRTFETYTRNTLDLSAVPALKELTHLPVIVDPSHGTGRRSLVPPMALASLAAGADGIMVEVHPDPDRSWTSDGKQSLDLAGFERLMEDVKRLLPHFGKELAPAWPKRTPHAARLA